MKNYLLFFALSFSLHVVSQEAYLYSGKNFTNYIYKVNSSKAASFLQSGTGNFYEVGLIKPFIGDHVFYSMDVSLNEYNAVGSTSTNSYRWNSEYLGIGAGVVYSCFPNHKASETKTDKKSDSEKKESESSKKNKSSKKYKSDMFNNYDVLFDLGVNGATIIQGKQEIDGIFYDLMDQKEFSGIVLGSHVGIKAKYHINTTTSCSVGYQFFESINVSNKTQEKIAFNTSQLLFGLHFNIN